MSATVVVDQRGASLSLAANKTLRLGYPDGETHRIGLGAVQRLVLMGELELTAGVIRACHEAGVDLVLMPRRGRGEAVHVLPGSHTGSELRHAQHRLFDDPTGRLDMARWIVQTKIQHQGDWLDAHDLPNPLPRLREQAASAPDLPTLIGIEGAASAGYFQSWRQLWQAPWTFPGRNRRPPRDPVNALLSLSYTMALGYLGRLISLHGLDPTIGFLHGPQRGRPALALDLLEILRPGLEHWVWTLLASSGELRPTDFNDSDGEGCRLSRDGRENYYTAWFRDEESRLRIPAREGLAGLLRGLRGGRPRDWGVNGSISGH